MLRAFYLGMVEFRRCFTTHFEDDRHYVAYDRGREWAHRLTLRCFEE